MGKWAKSLQQAQEHTKFIMHSVTTIDGQLLSHNPLEQMLQQGSLKWIPVTVTYRSENNWNVNNTIPYNALLETLGMILAVHKLQALSVWVIFVEIECIISS